MAGRRPWQAPGPPASEPPLLQDCLRLGRPYRVGTTMLSFPTELLILALLVLANGLLAMAETAVVSARKARLRQGAADGQEGAARALALAEQPARFLALVQFWLTLSGMIAGVLGGRAWPARSSAIFSGLRPSLRPRRSWRSSW